MVYYVNMKISDGCCIICCIVSIIWCITPLICSMFSIDIPYYVYTYVVLYVVFTQMECINQETHITRQDLPRRSVEVLFLDDESNLPRARRSIRRRRMGIQFPSFFTGGNAIVTISITNYSGSGYNWL